MIKKQLGHSNSPAFHPSNPDADPSKSKKAEGVAETTKVEGTVDPGRPGSNYLLKGDQLREDSTHFRLG